MTPMTITTIVNLMIQVERDQTKYLDDFLIINQVGALHSIVDNLKMAPLTMMTI